jgi:hypothetical protein
VPAVSPGRQDDFARAPRQQDASRGFGRAILSTDAMGTLGTLAKAA